MQNKLCMVSIDVEPDLDNVNFNGVKSLQGIIDVIEKHNIRATLFVTGEVLERFPELIKNWSFKHEIACHGCYYHKNLSQTNNKKELLGKFISLAEKNNLKISGFRAPKLIIDDETLDILQETGFKYDSSIIPSYPFFKKYPGYIQKSSRNPYLIKKNLMEIPNSPALFSFPLWGTWIRIFGTGFYKILFAVHKPKFISLAMHSWDSFSYSGEYSKNSGKNYIQMLDNLLDYLENYYTFSCGEDIYAGFKS